MYIYFSNRQYYEQYLIFSMCVMEYEKVCNGVFTFSLLAFGSKHILHEANGQFYMCILSLNFYLL